MAEIKLIPGGQQDQTPVSAQSPLKNPWVFFQEYRQGHRAWWYYHLL